MRDYKKMISLLWNLPLEKWKSLGQENGRYKNPKTGETVDFIDFCRSEGRFSKHFDKDGNASEKLGEAKQDRLENWRTLQELAGLI